MHNTYRVSWEIEGIPHHKDFNTRSEAGNLAQVLGTNVEVVEPKRTVKVELTGFSGIKTAADLFNLFYGLDDGQVTAEVVITHTE